MVKLIKKFRKKLKVLTKGIRIGFEGQRVYQRNDCFSCNKEGPIMADLE